MDAKTRDLVLLAAVSFLRSA